MRRAFTLIEVIIALFVIALTSTAATSLILQTNRSQNEETHRIQAHLLVEEVTNVVTMIRNSNWMRFGDDQCWLVPLKQKDCDNPPQEIIGKNYLLTQDPQDMHWELIAEMNGALDLKTGTNNAPYALYRNNVSGSSTYKLLYTPRPGTPKPANAQPEYYRMVTIEKGCAVTPNDNATDIASDINRAITITADIQWLIGSKPYAITERTCIFNDRAS